MTASDLGPEAVCQVRRPVMIQARESKSTPLPAWWATSVARKRHGDEANLTVHALGATLPLALAVERAARLVGVSRSSMYGAVKRGDVETTRLNGRTVVLTVPLLQRMGIDIR